MNGDAHSPGAVAAGSSALGAAPLGLTGAGRSVIVPTLEARARLVTGATIGTFLSVTSTVTIPFGVFLAPIATEFGWSRATVAGGFTALALANALMFPVAGRLADRLGTRAVLLIGYALLGLAVTGLSQLPRTPLAFYAMFAVIGGIGALPSSLIISKLLSEWFDSTRGFWLGFCSGVGNGAAGMLMPLVAVTLMGALGWRSAFVVFGVSVLVIGLPVTFALLRPPPARVVDRDAEVELDGMAPGEAMRTPLFWTLFVTVAVAGGCLLTVFANTISVLTARGIDIGRATLVVSIFAFVCTFWEPLIGFILDRNSRPRFAAPFYVCAAAGLILLGHAHSYPLVLLGGVLTGIGLGSECVLPYLLSRYFGLRAMATISGVAAAGQLISMAVTPVLLNYVFDRTGSYALGLDAVAALMLYTSVAFLRLRPYAATKTVDALAV